MSDTNDAMLFEWTDYFVPIAAFNAEQEDLLQDFGLLGRLIAKLEPPYVGQQACSALNLDLRLLNNKATLATDLLESSLPVLVKACVRDSGRNEATTLSEVLEVRATDSGPKDCTTRLLNLYANMNCMPRPSFPFDMDGLKSRDLLRRIRRASGLTRSETQEMDSRQVTVSLSQKGAFRPFRVAYMGANAWTLVLQGVYVYQIATGKEAPLHLCTKGRHFSDYDRCIQVPVHANDVLIQPPGTVHAAYTGADAIIANGFFYSADNFHESIENIRLQFRASRFAMYGTLCREVEIIFRNMEMPGLFSGAEKRHVWLTVGRLLRTLDDAGDVDTSLEFDALMRTAKAWYGSDVDRQRR